MNVGEFVDEAIVIGVIGFIQLIKVFIEKATKKKANKELVRLIVFLSGIPAGLISMGVAGQFVDFNVWVFIKTIFIYSGAATMLYYMGTLKFTKPFIHINNTTDEESK